MILVSRELILVSRDAILILKDVILVLRDVIRVLRDMILVSKHLILVLREVILVSRNPILILREVILGPRNVILVSVKKPGSHIKRRDSCIEKRVSKLSREMRILIDEGTRFSISEDVVLVSGAVSLIRKRNFCIKRCGSCTKRRHF